MNNYKTRLQLKTEVKQLLHGNWGRAILLFVVPMIYGSVLSIPANILGQVIIAVVLFTDSLSIALVMGILVILIMIAFSLLILLPTYSAMFKGLDWIRDDKLQFNAFTTGLDRFKNPDWWQIMLLAIISGLLSFLWSLLLIVPGIIKAISYSQAFYLYKDAQAKGLNDKFAMSDYVTMSKQLMNGHKKDYFVLQLSFLGWWFLTLLTMGIGSLWFMPYYNLTLANFYQNLIEHDPEVLDYQSSKKSIDDLA